MGYIEESSFISYERYREHLPNRLFPTELEVDSICFAMFALKANRGGFQAVQCPARVKSRSERASDLHIVKFCFLGTDLEEGPTFNAGFEDAGFFAKPEGYLAGDIPCNEGYLRTYEDGYDNFIRNCSTGLLLGASA